MYRCDADDAGAGTAYRLSLSLSFIAMPLAAWLSLVRPTYSLRHLSVLAVLQAMGYSCYYDYHYYSSPCLSQRG